MSLPKRLFDFLREVFSAPVDAAEAVRRTTASSAPLLVKPSSATSAQAPAAPPRLEIPAAYFAPAPSPAELEAVVGRWNVVGFASIEGEVDFFEDEQEVENPDPYAIDRWLNGDTRDLAAEAQAAAGLQLQIKSDGSYHEHSSGTTNLLCYDAEGVQTQDPGPSSGQLVSNGTHLYLRSNGTPPWSVPREGAHGPALLRLDDGGLKIADRIELMGDTLIRSLSIVTDELYLERIALVYRRETAEFDARVS
jgi:hypothetical protein